MRTIRITLRILLVLVILVLVAVILLVRNVSRRALPDYNADVTLAGLTGNVEVFRDSFGIPHVYAENELDLYRVTGYLQAQDRLWQMDLLRRVTTGRLSEIFGKDMIGADQLFRSLRIPEKSAGILDWLDPQILACMEAYADGVNQFINHEKLPFEFAVLGYEPELWTPIHSFNLIGYMAWDLSSGWSSEATLYKIARVLGQDKAGELIPDLELHDAIFPDFTGEDVPDISGSFLEHATVMADLGIEVFRGSNNWVVDGDHSSTGSPIVCNDMHLGLDMAPGIWSQMHQAVPGVLHVTGVMLPGAPFPVCGHNDSVAWGMTNVSADAVDFYIETVNPEDTTQYLLDGEWRDFLIVEEEIRVKGGDPVIRVNRFTHRGPVISGFKGIGDKVVSMRWIGNEPSNELRTIYLLSRAGNLADFKEAVTTFVSTSQNIVYGDASGNIGLFTCGGVPVRRGNRSLFAPGDTSLYDWTGILPFEKLPREVNPEKGYLISANNRTTGPEYPYHISHWYSIPVRFNRIEQLISGKDVLTPADMASIQSDQVSHWAQKFLPAIRSALEEAGLEGRRAEMYSVFRDWDGDMDASLPQPAIFEVFYLKLVEEVFEDELGVELFNEFLGSGLDLYAFWAALEGAEISWMDDEGTDATEDFADMIVSAWGSAAEWLTKNLGEEISRWEWGDLHQVSFIHPLGSVNLLKKIFRLEKGPFRVGGSYHTVSPFSYSKTDPFTTNHGASQRHIFPLGHWDESRMVIPTGVSGIPASEYFCNQSEMYIDYRYMEDLFTRERVEEYAVFGAVFSGQ